MGKSFKERDNGSKGRDVRGRGSGSKRGDVDVATVGYNQDIFKAVDRADGKATCKVSGGPFVLVYGDGTAPWRRQRVNRRRGEEARVRGGREGGR
jgi:hypothetical protein